MTLTMRSSVPTSCTDHTFPSVPGACTYDEAVAFRNRLHEIGKAAFVEETIAHRTVSAKKLCTAFGLKPPSFLEGAPEEAYHPFLAVAISREYSRRPKLPQYNSMDDAVRLLQESKNIVVLTGAGVSKAGLGPGAYMY